MTHIEEAVIETLRSGGPCCLDDVVTRLSPRYSWGEIFLAVNRMSRDGRVSFRQLGGLTYQIVLHPQDTSPVQRRVADGESASQRREY